MNLGSEDDPFCGSRLKFVLGDHFTRTFTLADISNTVLSGVGPIGIEIRINLVFRRILCEVLQNLSNLRLADALHEFWKALAVFPRPQIKVGDTIQSIRNSLGGYGNDWKTVGTGVFFPLPAQYDLEMRDFKSLQSPTHSVKANISNVVLSTAVETTTDLDV